MSFLGPGVEAAFSRMAVSGGDDATAGASSAPALASVGMGPSFVMHPPHLRHLNTSFGLDPPADLLPALKNGCSSAGGSEWKKAEGLFKVFSSDDINKGWHSELNALWHDLSALRQGALWATVKEGEKSVCEQGVDTVQGVLLDNDTDPLDKSSVTKRLSAASSTLRVQALQAQQTTIATKISTGEEALKASDSKDSQELRAQNKQMMKAEEWSATEIAHLDKMTEFGKKVESKETKMLMAEVLKYCVPPQQPAASAFDPMDGGSEGLTSAAGAGASGGGTQVSEEVMAEYYKTLLNKAAICSASIIDMLKTNRYERPSPVWDQTLCSTFLQSAAISHLLCNVRK